MSSSAQKNADPYGFYGQVAANQTAQNNLNAAEIATNANRVNQVTPWGNLTYDKQTNVNTDAWNAALENYNKGIAAIQDGTDTSQLAQFYRATGTLPNFTENIDDPKYTSTTWTSKVELPEVVQASLDSQNRVNLARSQASEDLIAQMRQIYGQSFNAPELADYLSKVPGVNTDNLGQLGDFTTDSKVNTDIAGALNGVNAVDQNVAAYDPTKADIYAKKAYDAQMALLQPQLDAQETRLRNGLALQGVNAGTEAGNGALTSFETGRAAQLNSLAADSYLKGNDAARSDYATQLSGLAAKNSAQNQAYTQALQTFLQGNAAQGQLFSQDQATYGAAQDKLRTNAALQQAFNQAQQQAYGQATNTYGLDWQAALAERARPVNEMNALLNGQQIQTPTFNNNGALQQTTTGADMTGAYNSWLQNTNNANAAAGAASANNTAALAGLAGTAAMAFAF